MKPIPFLIALLCVFCLCVSAVPMPAPNIVLLLADDLGWTDLGCYGADLLETPHLDRLAQESVRFTEAYAMPLCSPSRAALLTGRNAARLRVTHIMEAALSGGPKNRRLLNADTLPYLPHTETTLAKYLHEAGYLTALVGKWHLGDADYYPETHGFDVNIGGTRWGAPHTHFWPYSGTGRFYAGEFRYVPHLEFGHPGEYLTDRLTDEALRIIDHANGQPFFLYFAHHAPHLPIEAKPADVEYFTSKLRSGMNHQNPTYAAMVKTLDESVGRVLAHLKKRGLDKNTIVIFTSDNGGEIHPDKGQKVPITSNVPLRSGKGTLYEGGIRVPLLVRWPGVTPKGTACSEPVALWDLFHTLLAGNSSAQARSAADSDGLDLTPLLKNPAGKLDRDALFFHFPNYNLSPPVGAIRARDWKLLEYFEDNRVELYNLRDDISEQHDLAAGMPEIAADLRKRLQAWRASVGAAMPKPNPAFNLDVARPR